MDDPDYATELMRLRTEIVESFVEKAERVSHKALNVIDRALEEGNLDIAISVLQIYVKLLNQTHTSPSDVAIRVIMPPELENAITD